MDIQQIKAVTHKDDVKDIMYEYNFFVKKRLPPKSFKIAFCMGKENKWYQQMFDRYGMPVGEPTNIDAFSSSFLDSYFDIEY